MATNLPAVLSQYGAPAITYDPADSIRAKLRTTKIALAALVIGFGSAATFIPIGGAVVASGQVGVESRMKRVAHPTGGIISGIYVKNGDHVTKGQILMRFDDRVSGSDAELTSLSVDQLRAQKARLEAEQLGSATIDFPPELTASKEPGAVKAMADERKMLAIRNGEIAQQRAQLAARITQYEHEITGLQAQIDAAGKQIALIEPERSGLTTLYSKGLVTLNRRNQLERTAVDLQGNVASLQAQIAQTRAKITEAREQMIQLGSGRRSDAGQQLATVNTALNQQQRQSVTAGDLQDRSTIRAPYSGTVDKLAYAALGDVVKPAETIMEIVPDDDHKVVEVQVNPQDIDQLRVGQKVRIRFSAFNSTTTPEIAGSMLTIAADRSVDPDAKRVYYPARVRIDAAELARHKEMVLVPGMPAEVFISTGSRSMISFLTKPLRDQLERSFRHD